MALVPAVAGQTSNLTIGGKTYLQLVQQLRRECGVSGTGPNTTKNLTGELQRLADWINAAWVEIQGLHADWDFLRQPLQFSTQAGKQSYTVSEMLIGSFASLKLDSMTIHPVGQASAEWELPFMPYEDFVRLYRFGPSREQRARPGYFTLDAQRNLLLGPVPDAQYLVLGECYAQPTEFKDDGDKPALPSQFHNVIVYRAMMDYAEYESAPEVAQRAVRQYNAMMAKLAADQLPRVTFGAPLV